MRQGFNLAVKYSDIAFKKGSSPGGPLQTELIQYPIYFIPG
jgi:hypothetical protein